MAASFFALAILARSGPLFPGVEVPDLLWIPDLALALDQSEVNTSAPAPAPAADVDVEGFGLPSDAAFVEEYCFWPMPGEIMLERGELTDEVVFVVEELLMVDGTEV